MTDSTEGTDERRLVSEASNEWLPAEGQRRFDILLFFVSKCWIRQIDFRHILFDNLSIDKLRFNTSIFNNLTPHCFNLTELLNNDDLHWKEDFWWRIVYFDESVPMMTKVNFVESGPRTVCWDKSDFDESVPKMTRVCFDKSVPK